MVVSCIVLVVVHAHDEGAVDVLTGSGEDNLLSASLDVCLCLGAVGEETGGLEDCVNTQVLPGEVLGSRSARILISLPSTTSAPS